MSERNHHASPLAGCARIVKSWRQPDAGFVWVFFGVDLRHQKVPVTSAIDGILQFDGEIRPK